METLNIMNTMGRSEYVRQGAASTRGVLWMVPEGRTAQQENAIITATAAKMGLTGEIRTKVLLLIADDAAPQKAIKIYRRVS